MKRQRQYPILSPLADDLFTITSLRLVGAKRFIANFRDCCGEVTCQLAAIKYSAFAGQIVPGPIAEVGLPALVLMGGAYWVVRKFFGG